MYIDSGADISLIPRQLGEALGFVATKRDTQEIRGIGEKSVPVIISAVKMKIGRKVLDARIAWSLVDDVPFILGRMDVFDAFTVTFDQRRGIVDFISD